RVLALEALDQGITRVRSLRALNDDLPLAFGGGHDPIPLGRGARLSLRSRACARWGAAPEHGEGQGNEATEPVHGALQQDNLMTPHCTAGIRSARQDGIHEGAHL